MGMLISLLEIEQIRMERLALDLSTPAKAAQFANFLTTKFPESLNQSKGTGSSVELNYAKLTLSQLQKINEYLSKLA